MTSQEQMIINQMTQDLKNKKVWVEVKDGYRCYTDGKNSVPITSNEETIKMYHATFIAPQQNQTNTNMFDSLYKCNIFVGKPDSGKTYKAEHLCMDNNIPYILIPARDNLNLETLLENFKLSDEGKPILEESKAIKMLSGTEKCAIIIDEFNTLLTGVMKTMQPLLDNTSTQFEYKGTIYKKNPNCKFILTLNDKDKGISVIPDAILSRSKIVYFEQPELNTLAQWTSLNLQVVQDIYDTYKALGLLQVFGTRQLQVLKELKTLDAITSHFVGLCSLRGMDTSTLKTIETQRLLNNICTKL